MPPLKKDGQIALHMSIGQYMLVGMSVSIKLVQPITGER